MKGLKLSNTVYASKMMMGNGLDVQGGRLINNRPDSMSGIAQAAIAKKAMKRMEKIDIIAEGVSMGDMRSDMMGEY